MKLKYALALATALCMAQACTSVTATSYKGGYFGGYELAENSEDVALASNAEKVRGVVYSLPYTVLLVEGGHCVASEVAVKPAAKAEDAKKSDSDKTTITITNSPSTTATSTATANPPARDGQPPKPEADKKKECDPNSADSPYGVKVTPLTLADAAETYQVAFDLSGFSSDTQKLKISESGLLTSSNSSSKDESREAIVAFAKSVGTIVGAGGDYSTLKVGQSYSLEFLKETATAALPLAPFRVLCKTSTAEAKCEPTLLTGTNPKTVAVTPKVSIKAADLTDPNLAAPEPTDPNPACINARLCPGLLFRLRRDYLVDVLITPAPQDNFKPTATTFVVPIVDARRTYSVTPIRRTFVQSKTDLTFEKGVLVGIDGEYPSTGGAIVSLPADIIGAILGGIKDILTVRIETVEKQKELKDAQKALTEEDEEETE